ncbi:MAG: response regulator [Defluviitaleaceae bacterium]|nr:response regulator [Defluviitaleaceae bacterium]
MEHKYSILIVDDSETSIAVLSKILKDDFNLYAVQNGYEAFGATEAYMPDIILLDVHMIDMDGYEVMKTLRNSEKTKDIPVIFITGMSATEDEEKGLELGAVDYIVKPFSPAVVKLRIFNQIKILEQLHTIKSQMENIKTLEYMNIKNLLESTPYACYLWDRNMKMLECNDASLELFKVGIKDNFINHFFRLSPKYQPDGRISTEKASECLTSAFNEGIYVAEWMFLTTDGTSIPCEITLVRIDLQSDDLVVVYIKDLREQRAMLKEIEQQENLLYTVSSVAGILLQSSIEDFVADMYTCMGMMADAVHADRVYIWKNHTIDGDLHCTQVYEWSLGADPQQGTDITIDISYKESAPEWEEILSNGMCINSKVKDMSPASQAQLVPQGILSIFVTPVFLREEFWGFIGFDDCKNERIFADNEEIILRSAGLLIANSMLRNEMTIDLKTSANRLETALLEAQAANTAKSNFLSNMSHEIRTPMNALIGMGELLQHEQLNDRQRGYVNDIVFSANSLLGIINDILDFSKIESGKLDLNPVDYDFPAFVEHIKSMFVYIAEKKNLEFLLECGDNLPKVLYGDDIKLRQALTNIIGNAVKFTERGHVRLKITAENGILLFEISDTGIGIREEDLPKLFTAFEQVDKSKNRNVVGTGLGLSICKSFIQMMGGDITLTSEYGKGATFTITMPFVTGNKDRVAKKTYAEGYSISAPEAEVLVVDDNEFNLKVASGLLDLFNITAEMADSGYAAIELVKESDYDIVFMDHMMPGMDGIETVKIIREMGGKFNEIPIVALTANAIQGAREMFLSNGFNDFLSKPINSHDLIRVLENWLPPEKVTIKEEEDDSETRLDKMDDLLRKAMVTFTKENQSTFKKISDALEANDLKTVHLIAHTLKSGAAFLKKEELHAIALSLETSLQGNPPVYTHGQISALRNELEKALAEFEPIVHQMESAKPDAMEINKDELAILLSELRPLLEKNDFGAVDYVEKLQCIAGMEEVAERIDDYDFEEAFRLLSTF